MGVSLPPDACRFQDPSVAELCGHFIRLKVVRKLLFIGTNASTKHTKLKLINDIERDTKGIVTKYQRHNFMILKRN